MKILVLAQEPRLDSGEVATGNALRLSFLAQACAEVGHEILHTWQDPQGRAQPSEAAGRPYRDAAALAKLIADSKPDVVLASYWQLLQDLPSRSEIPVILDTVAPRLFEAMYEAPERLADEAAAMLTAFRRADFFLVGTARQRQVLIPQLILAGHDCRAGAPIAIVPICGGDPEAKAAEAEILEDLRFVTGGVDWPWRDAEPWVQALAQAIEGDGGPGEVLWYAGAYKLHAAATANEKPEVAHVRRLPLVPYGELPRAFGQAQIGLELADENPEREVSQSFRSVEMLRLGLPIICNRYLELADLVSAFDAGWSVETQADLAAVYQAIRADRALLSAKAEGAKKLYLAHFHYRAACRALLDVLPELKPRTVGRGLETVVTRSSPPPARSASQLKSVLIRGARWLLGLVKSRRPESGIIIISRDDIFPPNHGAAVKIHQTARGLARLVDHVFLVTDRGDAVYRFHGDGYEEVQLPFWLRLLSPPKRWVHRRLEAKGLPAGADLFLYEAVTDHSFILRSLYLGVRFPTQAYVAEFPAYCRAGIWGRALLGGQVMLVEHNVEYRRLQDQHDLSPAAYKTLKRIELDCCGRADVVICVSDNDKTMLVEDGVPASRIATVPHGVDLEEFDGTRAQDLRAQLDMAADQPLLVYHGAMIYPPNLEAVEILGEEILPRLRRKGLQPKVIAIGPHPPARSPDPDIVFLGPIESLGAVLPAADIAAVSLQAGGGTRMKILDYFAARVPVVSTTKGIEGIPVTPGQEARIEDDYDAFAEAIFELWNDKAAAGRQTDAAYGFVAPLDWSEIAKRYLALLPAVPAQR